MIDPYFNFWHISSNLKIPSINNKLNDPPYRSSRTICTRLLSYANYHSFPSLFQNSPLFTILFDSSRSVLIVHIAFTLSPQTILVRYLLARVPPCCYFELCIAVSCYYVPWTGGINKTFIGNVTSGLVSIRIYREYDNVREHVHAFEIRTWKFENWNLFREYLFRTLTILNLVSLIIYSLFFFKQFKHTWKSCNNNNGKLREFFISSLYIFFFFLMWKIPS